MLAPWLGLVDIEQAQVTQGGASGQPSQQGWGDHASHLLHAPVPQGGGGELRAAFPEHLIAAPLGQEFEGGLGLAVRQGEVLDPQAIQLLLPFRGGVAAVEHQGGGVALVPELGRAG